MCSDPNYSPQILNDQFSSHITPTLFTISCNEPNILHHKQHTICGSTNLPETTTTTQSTHTTTQRANSGTCCCTVRGIHPGYNGSNCVSVFFSRE